MATTYYYVIYSNTSRNGTAGLRLQIMTTSSETIITAADNELTRSGETLEDLAGVAWLEGSDGEIRPARDLTYDEVLALSIDKLADDGRLYAVFGTDDAGAAAFVESASGYGLEEAAAAIVAKWAR